MLTAHTLNNKNLFMLSSAEFHSDFKALIISTLEVGVTGLTLEKEIRAQALTSLLAEADSTFSWKALEPTLVSFFVEQENAHSYKVHAKAELILHCACVRCLTLVAHRIPLDFSIRMLEDSDHKLQDEEIHEMSLDSDSLLDENDFPVGYFSQRSIDLGLILREQIFLEVPDYPKCGGDRAKDKKACAPLLSAEQDSVRENPFAKLLKRPK